MSPFGWAALAALCWGVAPLVEKTGLRTSEPVVGVMIRAIGMLVGLVLLLLVSPRAWERLQEVPIRGWLWLGSGGFLASVIGQIFFYRALKGGEVSRVVPVGAAYPVIAFLLSLWLFREPLTASKALGVGFVVVGAILLR